MSDSSNSLLLASFGISNNQIICDTNEVLTVLEIARVLPNQRLVCKCLFNAQTVYVKLFIGLRANIHEAREAAGMMLLENANILTPSLLLQTTTNSQPVLVFNAIENAQNIEDFMRENDFIARKKMSEKLAKTLALHHQANLIQTDIHLKNFLVANNMVHTIDGDGIKQTQNSREKQKNLATLLSKFDVLDDCFMQCTVEAYCVAANENFDNKVFLKTQFLAQKIRRKTASEYADKKVFRNCTDVAVKRESGNFFALNTQFLQANIACTPNAFDEMIKQCPQLLKNGNSATVAKINLNNQAFVLKRYNIKNIFHGVRRALRPSRAAVSWANAYRLQLLGIATAKPVALLETRKFGLRGKAYFLAENTLAPDTRELDSAPDARESDSAPDVAQYFAQTKNKADRAEAVKNIVTLFYKLYLLQISHGDMKATNIKMQSTQPVLIDLDSMRQHQTYFKSSMAHSRDLSRFMQNWNTSNKPSDIALYNAFVKTFKVVYPDISILIKAGIGQNKDKSHKEINQ